MSLTRTLALVVFLELIKKITRVVYWWRVYLLGGKGLGLLKVVRLVWFFLGYIRLQDTNYIADEQIAMMFELEHGENLNFLFTSKK